MNSEARNPTYEEAVAARPAIWAASGNDRVRLFKPLVFLLCLLPAAMLVGQLTLGDPGANPVETLLHGLGDWSLRFLLITLAVTPLRRMTGWTQLVRFRRMLGLFAFFYASMHLLVYLWLDRELSWSEILVDVFERPYITLGFVAYLIITALAVTSPKAMVRRLGRRWKRLHKWVYIAALLGVAHFLWLVKADYTEPLIYAMLFLLLMAARLRSLSFLS